MDRFSKEHFELTAYNYLIKENLTPSEIAQKHCESLKDTGFIGKTRAESYIIRTDNHWLENIGRHLLGFSPKEPTSWKVSV